jgi:hypothetical protein
MQAPSVVAHAVDSLDKTRDLFTDKDSIDKRKHNLQSLTAH